MKYLKDATTKLLNETGAFFAFSDKQFNEQKKEGVEYCHLFAGLVSPKANAKAVMDGLSNITAQGIAADIAENGKENIIKRELYNHEAFYTDDITSTTEALDAYGFTVDEIRTVYRTERHIGRNEA